MDHLDPKTTLFIDLLDYALCDELSLNPKRFDQIISQEENKSKIIVIDEVQKLPQLLDRVHHFIVKEKRIFFLTGSSSRRLKQRGVNLLAGRAFLYHLYPLSSKELGPDSLQRLLCFGGLPMAYFAVTDNEAREYLRSYIQVYLEKEIQQEQWVKKIIPFKKFLRIAAQMSGKIINKSAIASDIGVDDMTVHSYFEILEDTLIGFWLPMYSTSVRKSIRQASKFYLIDTGVKRALSQELSMELQAGTSVYGELFEQWIVLEIKKRIEYARLDWEMYYVRSKNDVEIDLVITRPGRPLLMIEIKSSARVSEKDAKHLLSLGSDISSEAEKYILSQDPEAQVFEQVKAYCWEVGLDRIFNVV
jgi:predicted AAA+ superfamily ATPase